MERKCSLSSHKEIDAISFCYECKIFMCNKCEKLHSEVLENHHQYKIDKENDINEIFTGLCKEINHQCELKYFCKTHNILCCAECITKIKGKDHGQHTDCDICSIYDIEKEKKNKLEENIQTLEKMFNNLKDTIDKLKNILEKIEKDKEEKKMQIQKVFTNLRNLLNEREDELLSKIDKVFNEEYFDESLIKQCDNLPKKIELSLEKGKMINKNNKNINLNCFINDCLNIENNMIYINKINNGIQKFNFFQKGIIFDENKEGIQHLCEIIKKLQFIYKCDESEIINKDDFIKINNWIGGSNNFILKYNAKRDNCDTNIFHEKCDNISGSIFICKVVEGDIVGGYISVKIEKKTEFLDDNKAFLFNLSKNIIKKNKKSNKKAIKNFGDSSYFIRFGSDCEVLSISGNCLTDTKSQTKFCSCGGSNYDCDNYNLFNKYNSSDYFKIENFEVFQVIQNL